MTPNQQTAVAYLLTLFAVWCAYWVWEIRRTLRTTTRRNNRQRAKRYGWIGAIQHCIDRAQHPIDWRAWHACAFGWKTYGIDTPNKPLQPEKQTAANQEQEPIDVEFYVLPKRYLPRGKLSRITHNND